MCIRDSNFGHGKSHLASLLASLILLAFALHSVLDWIDLRYRALRQKGLARMALLRTPVCKADAEQMSHGQ